MTMFAPPRSKSQHSINEFSSSGCSDDVAYPEPPVAFSADWFDPNNNSNNIHHDNYSGARQRFAVQRRQSFMPPRQIGPQGLRGPMVRPNVVRRQRQPLPQDFIFRDSCPDLGFVPPPNFPDDDEDDDEVDEAITNINQPEVPVVKPPKMVSRRKILSKSRDDLIMDTNGYYRDEEDVWYMKEKLYKDHIAEVLAKWDAIDDEIWAKVIVMERNRRVAKAYARAPVLTVNGSADGFDGFRIGVNGFENPLRDPKTEEFKEQIGQGCKIKMDESGNILIKRFAAKSGVFVKNTLEENAISNDILKLSNGALELEKPLKLFDMKKFQQNVNRELKRPNPDRAKLECQCISAIAFVKNEQQLLDSPIWIMLINVVALEMLKAKMPTSPTSFSSKGANSANSRNASPNKATANAVTMSRPSARHSSEPRKRFPASGSSDEDPYSLTPSGSSGSSGGGSKPGLVVNGVAVSSAQIAAREKEYFGPQNWAKQTPRQDYSDDMDDIPVENATATTMTTTTTLKKKSGARTRGARMRSEESKSRNKDKGNNSSSDDPYYCGLKARVPNYISNKSGRAGRESGLSRSKNAIAGAPKSPLPSRSVPNLQNLAQLPTTSNPFWWHSRLYPGPPAADLGMTDLTNYHYPGRTRGYRSAFLAPTQPPQRQAAMYRPGWE